MCPDCDRFSKLSRLGTLKYGTTGKMLVSTNIKFGEQDIAEHTNISFAKEFKYFYVFCAKSLPQKKEATIFVPSSSTAIAIGIKNFVRMKR